MAAADESSPVIVRVDRESPPSNWPYFVCRLSVALFGDSFFQIVFIFLGMPLDSAPWFGVSNGTDQTLTWMKQGFREVYVGRPGSATPTYFALYFVGFYVSHILGAALSYYSPQLTAFIYSVNTPMNLILLAAIPAWNVFGVVAPVWASAASIPVMSVGALMYAAWEHMERVAAAECDDGEGGGGSPGAGEDAVNQ